MFAIRYKGDDVESPKSLVSFSLYNMLGGRGDDSTTTTTTTFIPYHLRVMGASFGGDNKCLWTVERPESFDHQSDHHHRFVLYIYSRSGSFIVLSIGTPAFVADSDTQWIDGEGEARRRQNAIQPLFSGRVIYIYFHWACISGVMRDVGEVIDAFSTLVQNHIHIVFLNVNFVWSYIRVKWVKWAASRLFCLLFERTAGDRPNCEGCKFCLMMVECVWKISFL